MRCVYSLFMAVILALTLMTAAVPVTVSAEEGYSVAREELTEELDDLLTEYDLGYRYEDVGGISFRGLLTILRGRLSAGMSAPVRMLGTIIVLVVFCAVVKSVSETAFSRYGSGIFGMISVLTAVTAIAPQLLTVYERSLEVIELTAGFTLVYVPVFTAVTAAAGGLASAGVYHVMILAASELLLKLSQSFLLPVLSVCCALAVSGSVFPSAPAESIVKLLKKAVTLAITLSATLFTGFLSMKCSIAAKADSAGDKTVKLLLSGAVPVIGGAVSDAYSTVKGSLGVIRSTVGAAGVIAILVILLPPLLELMAFRLAMWIGTAAAEVFSAEPIVKLLKSFDEGLAIAQCVMAVQGGLLMICTAIFMNANVG